MTASASECRVRRVGHSEEEKQKEAHLNISKKSIICHVNLFTQFTVKSYHFCVWKLEYRYIFRLLCFFLDIGM